MGIKNKVSIEKLNGAVERLVIGPMILDQFGSYHKTGLNGIAITSINFVIYGLNGIAITCIN